MQTYYSNKSKAMREMLKGVSKHKYKLLALEDRYSRLYMQSRAKGQQITGMPFFSHYKPDNVGGYSVELVNLEELILEERCNLVASLRDARRFINKIDDQTIRDILNNKYIRCKDEIEVATMVHLSMKAVDKIINIFFQTDVNYI